MLHLQVEFKTSPRIITIVSIINNTIAGGRSSGRNLMDDYLQNKTSTNPDASATPSQRFILISNNALVFNRGATGVDPQSLGRIYCHYFYDKPLGIHHNVVHCWH
jgi:ABC-type microcin C transport system permease subunit YejB